MRPREDAHSLTSEKHVVHLDRGSFTPELLLPGPQGHPGLLRYMLMDVFLGPCQVTGGPRAQAADPVLAAPVPILSAPLVHSEFG